MKDPEFTLDITHHVRTAGGSKIATLSQRHGVLKLYGLNGGEWRVEKNTLIGEHIRVSFPAYQRLVISPFGTSFAMIGHSPEGGRVILFWDFQQGTPSGHLITNLEFDSVIRYSRACHFMFEDIATNGVMVIVIAGTWHHNAGLLGVAHNPAIFLGGVRYLVEWNTQSATTRAIKLRQGWKYAVSPDCRYVVGIWKKTQTIELVCLLAETVSFPETPLRQSSSRHRGAIGAKGSMLRFSQDGALLLVAGTSGRIEVFELAASVEELGQISSG